MTASEWLEANKEAIEKRYMELVTENPGASILRPGFHEAINGVTYFSTEFIIAK